jgi:glc operon protein GlcG
MIRRGSRVANHSSLYIVGYIEADQGVKTMTTLKVLLTSSALLLSAISAGAQQPATPAAPAAPAAAPPAAAPAAPLVYGAPITLEMAKRAVAAAEAEARKNNWNVMIVVLDSGGHTVMSQRLDGTQYASIRIAAGKARTALEFKRPTKALDDTIAAGGGGLRLLSVGGVTAIEGGIPIVVDGKIVGSIGVSGVTAQQDAQIARAGAEAVK